jgi:hypothetical protein
MTSSDRDRLKALERENRELRRANEILRKGFGLFCRGGVTGSRAAPTEMMVSFIDDHRADYGVEPICDTAAGRPADLVQRQFVAAHPNQLWVADITDVATWSGSTGSTTAGSWSPSATSRRRSWKWRIIANWKSQPWRPDSNKRVSGIPGVSQFFDYLEDLEQQPDMIQTAYVLGVPMGGDLESAEAVQAPRRLVQAMRDANSAPLQKIQIVKGLLANGQTHEQVYEVVCSDGLQPDARTHLCPNNGARVNLSDCSIAADKGAAELATTWTDPDFYAGSSAFYSARVLENRVYRWSQHDANAIGKPHPDSAPATVQERAWTSPIWYGPQG